MDIYIALVLGMILMMNIIIRGQLIKIQNDLKQIKSNQGQEPPITRRGRPI